MFFIDESDLQKSQDIHGRFVYVVEPSKVCRGLVDLEHLKSLEVVSLRDQVAKLEKQCAEATCPSPCEVLEQYLEPVYDLSGAMVAVKPTIECPKFASIKTLADPVV